ncbi:MAG: pilus assembly protein N-terminal domain-containing protein, partial [Planctomycetota bacterium]
TVEDRASQGTRITTDSGGGMRLLVTVLVATWVAVISSPVAAQEGDSKTQRLIRGNYHRLFFDRDVTRLAVGDEDLLSFELVSTREALILGKELGRTNLIVWYGPRDIAEFQFSIEEDLTLLREALREIDPRITIEIAPNRPALVLRGTVKNAASVQQALEVSRSYLSASRRSRSNTNRGAVDFYARALLLLSMIDSRTEGEPEAGDALPAAGIATNDSAVINLLVVEEVPDSPEEKIRKSIASLGGTAVTVRRVLAGPLPDDAKDVLILEGKVANQVTLVRVLSVASRILTGRSLRTGQNGQSSIRVIASEGGGVMARQGAGGRGGQQGQQNRGGGAQGGGGGIAGNGGGLIPSDIQTNVARAKALEAAGGRILSFIEVTDLPIVRVNVKFYEVNRTQVLNYSSDWGALLSDFPQPALQSANVAPAFQPNPAQVGTFGGTDVQNVLSSLGGGLGNQFQLTANHFAVDTAFDVLEAKGLARRLSSPSLAVLSGETAQLTVGGEVPIQEIFSPVATSNSALGVFGSVRFRSFGITLGLRPQVDEDDMITLELSPSVSQPDQQLTSVLVSTTGNEQVTTAFQSRSLQTNSRLRDGQTILDGCAMSRESPRVISPPRRIVWPSRSRLFV